MKTKELQEKTIEIIDSKMDEVLKREARIIDRFSISLPKWAREMSVGVRLTFLRELAQESKDLDLKRGLAEIDNLRVVISELLDIKKRIRGLQWKTESAWTLFLF